MQESLPKKAIVEKDVKLHYHKYLHDKPVTQVLLFLLVATVYVILVQLLYIIIPVVQIIQL